MDKKEFLDTFASVTGDSIKFNMPVDADELIGNCEGIEMLNNKVDDFVEDGYLMSDLSYEIVKLEGSTLIVKVSAECSEFLDTASLRRMEMNKDSFC